MKPSHITVTAPPGRLTPVHPDDGRVPGGHLMYVEPGKVRRVRLSPDVSRAIGAGDLIPCTMDGSRVASVDLAASPDHIDHGQHVSPTRRWEPEAALPFTPPVPPPVPEGAGGKKGGAS